ncbi:MAG: hypothetical protein KKB21_00015 [Nanoarchaeota archaeon]|nr:hypothetical protein [Nanoarchaeota archaeon]MBU4085944.1 hypothetical protein [Nanoarchaeota archaeon]
MDIFNSIKEAFSAKLAGINLSSGELLLNILIALFLVIVGIFAGKIVKFVLRKLLERLKIEKIAKASFVNLFLVVVKWSIYILFIDIALIQLGIPALTNWLTTILGVIPSLTGALIIISVGFAIATYLKRIISESRVEGWQVLSQIFFFFITSIFVVLALKTALLSLQDQLLSNILIVSFTLLGGIALLIYYFRLKNQSL